MNISISNAGQVSSCGDNQAPFQDALPSAPADPSVNESDASNSLIAIPLINRQRRIIVDSCSPFHSSTYHHSPLLRVNSQALDHLVSKGFTRLIMCGIREDGSASVCPCKWRRFWSLHSLKSCVVVAAKCSASLICLQYSLRSWPFRCHNNCLESVKRNSCRELSSRSGCEGWSLHWCGQTRDKKLSRIKTVSTSTGGSDAL